MSQQCRICGETTQYTYAKKLFDAPHNILLHQIELLTGEWLNFEQDLPCYICMSCEQDLNVASAFRKRCIETQRLLKKDKQHILITTIGKHSSPQPSNKNGEDSVDYDYAFPYLPFDSCEQTEKSDTSVCEENGELEPSPPSSVPESPKNDEEPQMEKKVESNIPDTTKETRKYINWKILTKEEKRKKQLELKRLRMKTDCICEHCGRHFNNASNFKVHLIRHTGVKNFQCKTCDLKFYTLHLLRLHEKLHTGVPRYKCQYCEETFKYASRKTEHERRLHTFELPFHCSYCEKSFSNSNRRKDHELVHTGVRKYSCGLCDQQFLRKGHLNQHLRSKTHKKNTENSEMQSAPDT